MNYFSWMLKFGMLWCLQLFVVLTNALSYWKYNYFLLYLVIQGTAPYYFFYISSKVSVLSTCFWWC